MELKIGKYTLHSDKYCAWLTEEKNVKTKSGKDTTKNVRVSGYYREFEFLLRDFIHTRVKDSDATEVKEVLALIDKTQKEAVQIAKAAVKADFHIVRYPGKEK